MEASKVRLMIKKKALSKKELVSIQTFLEECSKEYYNTSHKTITDGDYDYIYERYVLLGGTPFSGAEPPEETIVAHNTESKHSYQELVGTTFKAHDLLEFNDWLDKTYKLLGLSKEEDILGLNVTLKFDGNSILIEYDKRGVVSKALTRGKNGIGLDRTRSFSAKKFQINNPYEVDLGIKYECLIKYSALEEINEIFGKDYKNPRSAVSGMLNGDDSVKYKDFFTLEPLWVKLDTDEQLTREEEILFLKDNHDSDVFNNLYSLSGTYTEIVDDMKDVYQEIIDMRMDLDYMIDGIVVDISDSQYREKLGYVDGGENLKPKWCIAVKFPYMEQESIVTNMKFTTGDSGRISPVCYFEPVKFNGATHTKQYLQGYSRFQELQLCIGTRISVQLHNDTLSYIERLDTIEGDKRLGRTPIKFINHCPICGEKLSITRNEFGVDTFAYCRNDFCPGNTVGKINNYFSRMDIKGTKTSTIQKLYDAKLWKSIPDIYTFDIEKAYFIEGLGKSSIDKLVSSIEKKKYYDYEILGSMGIHSCGRDISKSILTNFTLESLVETCDEIKSKPLTVRKTMIAEFIEALSTVEGVAEKMARAVYNGICKNMETIDFLMKRGYKKIADDNNFDEERYTFVVTGDLNDCNRDQLKFILERRGHKLVGSISSKTDYLITNTPNSGTVKNKKALDLGKKIITEEELYKLLNISDINSEIVQ